MIALVLDTSSAAVSAGVVDIRQPAAAAPEIAAVPEIIVLAEQVTIDARAHGELLVPSIRSALAAAGRQLSEVDCVVAGVGPGPFTGLRIGLVTAAALSDALGKPAYGVCSLDAIAEAVAGNHPSPTFDRLLVAADARRREVYWAEYRIRRAEDRVGAIEMRLRVGPAVDLPRAVAALIRPAGDPVEAIAMTGAGARLYAPDLGLPLLEVDYPTVAGLAACAAARVLAQRPGEALTPLYLRRPDAVPATQTKAVSQR